MPCHPPSYSRYNERYAKVVKFVPFQEPLEPEVDQPSWDSTDLPLPSTPIQSQYSVDDDTIRLLERNWKAGTDGKDIDSYAAATD